MYTYINKGDKLMENYYYRVTDSKGVKHSYYRQSDAFHCYNYDGVRIATVTKDLFPVINVVIDTAGFDTERIRKDMTVKETTEALRRAVDKYDKDNTRQFKIKLNNTTDKDIIEYLDTLSNKQGFIKELIREHIKKNRQY